MAETDEPRDGDFEMQERIGGAFCDQTGEAIKEAVARAVAEVRNEERRGAEDRPDLGRRYWGSAVGPALQRSCPESVCV